MPIYVTNNHNYLLLQLKKTDTLSHIIMGVEGKMVLLMIITSTEILHRMEDFCVHLVSKKTFVQRLLIKKLKKALCKKALCNKALCNKALSEKAFVKRHSVKRHFIKSIQSK